MSAANTRRRSRAGQRALPAPRLALAPPLYSIVALLACLGALGAALAGVFTVSGVTVRGGGLPTGAIVRAADVKGANIFAVQSDAVVARVSAIRNVAVQRVETSFPNRVTIFARVRPAMAAWRQGSILYLLDAGGQIIGRTTTTTLPVINSTGASHPLDPAIIVAVRAATRRLPPGTVAQFRVGANGLTILSSAGWTAIVGNGRDQTLVNRIATLAAFLQATRGRPQQLQLVDLRYHVPYARYAP